MLRVLICLELIALHVAATQSLFPPGDLARLDGRIVRAGIQFDCWGLVGPPTAWQGQCIWTEDRAFLDRVETWLWEVRRPMCENALRQRGNRLFLVYDDGRHEEILFLGPARPGPSTGRCGGFLWQGLSLMGGQEPITDFLRARSNHGQPGS